jgi:hypothetical protein
MAKKKTNLCFLPVPATLATLRGSAKLEELSVPAAVVSKAVRAKAELGHFEEV